MKNTVTYIIARAARRAAESFRLQLLNAEIKKVTSDSHREMVRHEALERSKFIITVSKSVNNLRFGNTRYAAWYQQMQAVQARRAGIAAKAEHYKNKGKFIPAGCRRAA